MTTLNRFARLALLPALLALQSCSQAPVVVPGAPDTTAIQLNQVGYLPGGSKWAALPEAAAETLAHRLVPTLVDLESARACSRAASGPCEIFVKVDVGLERLGVPAEQAVKTILAMLELPRLTLAGLCAHPHAEPGGDPAYADWQAGRFTAVVDELEARGVRVPVRLLAASPFVLRFPHTYLNAVDPGRMLYGITFPAETPPLPLRPVLRALATRVIAVKELAPRERFAEQAPFPVTGPMRLGVVPMGSAGAKAQLLARGGRVCGADGEAVRIGTATCPIIAVTEVDARDYAGLARAAASLARDGSVGATLLAGFGVYVLAALLIARHQHDPGLGGPDRSVLIVRDDLPGFHRVESTEATQHLELVALGDDMPMTYLDDA